MFTMGTFILFSLLVCFSAPICGLYAKLGLQHQLQSRSAFFMSVSVGGSSSAPPPSPGKQQGFIISPRLDAFEAEMMIIDNFNQIQQVRASTLFRHEACSLIPTIFTLTSNPTLPEFYNRPVHSIRASNVRSVSLALKTATTSTNRWLSC